MKKYYVYILINPLNNKPFYIGKGSNGRMKIHEYFSDLMGIIGLLDLDGVIILPGGYRKAFQDTLKIILEQAGLTVNVPGDNIVDFFESMGVTNEWDMVAICLAIVLDELLSIEGKFPFDIEFNYLIEQLGVHIPNDISIEYEAEIKKFTPYLNKYGFSPSRALLDFVLSNQNNKMLSRLAQYRIIQTLLGDTSAEISSPTTRLFQNLVLGNQLFEMVYGQKASITTNSYLELYDVPLLNSSVLEFIKQLNNLEKVKFSIYTARNSYPPREADGSFSGYAPEAEMAMKVAGINSLPLISTGRLNYLANGYKRNLRHYLKPAPYQALAAIAAAVTGDELEALEWTMRVSDSINKDGLLTTKNTVGLISKEMEDLDIHIFEDSPNGIISGKAVVKLLCQLGARVRLHTRGITERPIKITALLSEGAIIKNNINEALIQAFSNLM